MRLTLHRYLPIVFAGLAVMGFGVVTGAGTQVPQPAVSRVLVMPFAMHAEEDAPAGAAASRWLGEAAASLLADELSALGMPALPRDERVAVFDRLRVPMSTELTRATMIRIGELIGASEIVFGEVRLGQQLHVRTRAIQLHSGRQLPDTTDSAALSDIYPLFSRVAAQVTRHAGRPSTAAVKPAPLPLPVLENYIKGLMAVTPASQQRFLESAMTQAPRDGRILTALWDVYTELGLHEKALSVASAVPPDSVHQRRARFNLSLSLIELKRFDGAFKELSTLHEQKRAAAVSNALGIVQLRRGAGATPAPAYFFERAANEQPRETDYLFNLGYARALSGDTNGALSWLREVVRHDAGDGDAHLVMATVLAAAGRTAEAQREQELARLLGTSLDAIAAAPGRTPPPDLERVRTALDESGLGAGVLAAPAQRDQLETARFHLDRGRSLVGEWKDREAETELRRSIYLAPYEDEPHLLLGRIYQRGGRLGEAIDEYKVAIWCRESPAARIALASALIDAGDRLAARTELERALVLAPGSAEARALLQKIGG